MDNISSFVWSSIDSINIESVDSTTVYDLSVDNFPEFVAEGMIVHNCITYNTNGKWLPIDQVIPPGTLCTCHGRCRCFIRYRRFINPPLTQSINRLVS